MTTGIGKGTPNVVAPSLYPLWQVKACCTSHGKRGEDPSSSWTALPERSVSVYLTAVPVGHTSLFLVSSCGSKNESCLVSFPQGRSLGMENSFPGVSLRPFPPHRMVSGSGQCSGFPFNPGLTGSLRSAVNAVHLSSPSM